jgi:hypothetical protein
MLERAYKELDRYQWDKTELLIYDEADLQDRVYRGTLAQQYDEGFDKGEEQTIERVVTAMLEQGLADTVICSCTRLPLEALRLLKEHIKNPRRT